MQILDDIKNGVIAPIYFFYGEEQYLVDQTLKKCLDLIIDPTTSDFNFDVFYGSDITIETILDRTNTLPLMSAKRVVVLKEIEKLSMDTQEKKYFQDYIENPAESTVLICIGGKIDLRKQPFKSLYNTAKTIEFKTLYENKIPNWIITYVTSYNKSISPAATRLLQAFAGNNLLTLSKEIDKLILYIQKRDTINDKDIEEVVGISREFNIFELCNAVGMKQFENAVRILRFMLDQGERPVGIIVMLVRHFNILWKLSELCIINGKLTYNISSDLKKKFAKQLSISYYYFDEYLRQLMNLPLVQIEKIFYYLLEADTNLKVSYQKPELVLDLALYKMIQF